MDEAAKYVLRQRIAGVLDYPSVYMGGPSPSSVRRAIKIVESILDGYEVIPRAAAAGDIEHVKTWRKSPWDSLERI